MARKLTDANRDIESDEDYHARIGTLLDKARAGDRPSLHAIVRELSPLLWHVVRSEGLDEHYGADVMQATWIALLGSLHKIREPVALSRWLITTCRREAWRVAKARRAGSLAATEIPEETDPAPSPEDRLVAHDRDQRLWAAVAQLPELCQRLLRVVAFVHRPDYREVSVALGIPRGSIGPTRGRCLAQLRTKLVVDGEWP